MVRRRRQPFIPCLQRLLLDEDILGEVLLSLGVLAHVELDRHHRVEAFRVGKYPDLRVRMRPVIAVVVREGPLGLWPNRLATSGMHGVGEDRSTHVFRDALFLVRSP